MAELVTQIDACLPQTQCQRCGYPSCRDYAEAICFQDAPINRCPPGGERSIVDLAQLLKLPIVALDETLGEPNKRLIAQIRESECIGCAACLKVCPTDTIIGRNKTMHTVVEVDCTGCELCIDVCPIDCIDFHEIDKTAWPQNDRWPQWSEQQSNHWRTLYSEHLQRKTTKKKEAQAASQAPAQKNKEDILNEIQAALLRTQKNKS